MPRTRLHNENMREDAEVIAVTLLSILTRTDSSCEAERKSGGGLLIKRKNLFFPWRRDFANRDAISFLRCCAVMRTCLSVLL